MVETLEQDGVLITLRADGIVSFSYEVDLITEELALRVLHKVMTRIKKPMPTLVLMNQVRKVTRGARETFVSDDNLSITSRVALVVSSPVQRVIGNFFMGLNRPPIATHLFTSEEKAIKWLQEESS